MLQDSIVEQHEPANDFALDGTIHEVETEDHNDVGAVLCHARTQSGYSLEQISQSLNIRLQHLKAIEESRLDALPGAAYAVGFVKAYASFLGLDEQAIVGRYKEEIHLVPGHQRLSFPEPVDEARVPKGTMIALSLVAAMAIYGVWYFVSSYDALKMVSVPDVPDRVASNSVGPQSIFPSAADVASDSVVPEAAAAQADDAAKTPGKAEGGKETVAKVAAAAATTAPDAKPTATAPAKVAAADQSNASGQSAPAADATAQAAQQVASLEPPVGAAPAPVADDEAAAEAADQAAAAAPIVEQPHVPKVYGAGNADARIVIRAATDSWVQVEDANENILLSRVLKTGDSYRVPNRDGLTMMTGNAGALDIVVDGESVGSLGPLGAVRKGVDLAPQALQARVSTARN